MGNILLWDEPQESRGELRRCSLFLELIVRSWVYTVIQGNVYPRSVQSGGPRGSQRHARGPGSAHAIWRGSGAVSAAQRHVCVLLYRPYAGGGPAHLVRPLGV